MPPSCPRRSPRRTSTPPTPGWSGRSRRTSPITTSPAGSSTTTFPRPGCCATRPPCCRRSGRTRSTAAPSCCSASNGLLTSAPPTRTASAPPSTGCCAETSRPRQVRHQDPRARGGSRPDRLLRQPPLRPPARRGREAAPGHPAGRRVARPARRPDRPAQGRDHPAEGTHLPVSHRDQRAHHLPRPGPGPASRTARRDHPPPPTARGNRQGPPGCRPGPPGPGRAVDNQRQLPLRLRRRSPRLDRRRCRIRSAGDQRDFRE
jgi:hypothetical protein